ncbi:MAG: GTP pyrophosphokinase family protein [Ruminococcus sp.]|nr:GTP pyrophosphokinase family protein [Ruminococcus sp.]
MQQSTTVTANGISKNASSKEAVTAFFEEEDYERARKYLTRFQTLMTYYKCAMYEIETKFKVLNEAFSPQLDRNPISSIKCRLKTPESIQEKLHSKGYHISLDTIEEKLNDIAGVRVTCSFIDDVYMLADALLMQDDITLIDRKDYIKNPKPNGYRSLHLIVIVPIFLPNEKQYVKVEIQLRTIAMDFWASLEHQLKYKKDVEFTEAMAKELYTCADISSKLDGRMNCLRKSVMSDYDSSTDEAQDDSLDSEDLDALSKTIERIKNQ